MKNKVITSKNIDEVFAESHAWFAKNVPEPLKLVDPVTIVRKLRQGRDLRLYAKEILHRHKLHNKINNKRQQTATHLRTVVS